MQALPGGHATSSPVSSRHGAAHSGALAVPRQARIVSQGAGYVVVDKPAGVPVVHSLDNVVESCLTCVAQAYARVPELLGYQRVTP